MAYSRDKQKNPDFFREIEYKYYENWAELRIIVENGHSNTIIVEFRRYKWTLEKLKFCWQI